MGQFLIISLLIIPIPVMQLNYYMLIRVSDPSNLKFRIIGLKWTPGEMAFL